MPEEMLLLRNALKARGIPYINASDNLDRSFPLLNLIIYRTRFMYKGEIWIVISGYGTMGGDKGLLELRRENKDVVGCLTAKKILEELDYA